VKVQSKHRELPGARRLSDGHTLYWWAEVLAIGAFYFVYSAVRNSNKAGWEHALHNAERVIGWERFFGLYHEETIQSWALHFKPLIIASNYFYGSLHFVVTIAAGVLLFRKFTDEYPRYRNMLAITTVIALIGFKLFPLMPPRLIDQYSTDDYPFVDTLAKYPTFWSFNSGAVSRISNQYAAMPSVHIAWATWCALVFAPRVRHRWARLLAIAYPVLTLVVIVITANHWWLDAVGGLVLLALGWFLSGWLTRAGRSEPEPDPEPARAIDPA
jgi:PAP2 superfamily